MTALQITRTHPQMTQMDADKPNQNDQACALIGAPCLEHKRPVFNLRHLRYLRHLRINLQMTQTTPISPAHASTPGGELSLKQKQAVKNKRHD